ncbi:hypothetical protein AURDEDRAFT_184728 [Auricularia subglabra TFB-10046 SS5]|nr:hypothetical protein AURDEDRAFT_184728 [Auricularia subglabra TFB-10046 SS5]
MRLIRCLASLLALPLLRVSAILPIETPQCLAFASSKNTVTFLAKGQITAFPSIITSPSDWPGSYIPSSRRTTGTKIPVVNRTTTSTGSGPAQAPLNAPTAIIAGTIGRSDVIDALVKSGKIDVSAVRGEWEAFLLQHVASPMPGIKDALVIAGADKRGTIFGLYTLSEQLGVSPWWYWTDSPPAERQNGVFLVRGSDCSAGTPTVQYRGIFFNDEQPALTNWANEKLRPAGSNLPTFRSNFYVMVFELILRMKANFLWPAIWNSMFAIDDPMSQFLADYYGVVMGTSHQEPMMRSTPLEFNKFAQGPYDFQTNAANITQYWVDGTKRAKPFESVFTMGMRGAGDLPLGDSTNIALLEKIIDTQRQIIQDVFNTTDQTSVPQVWCLYKEVQNYYAGGLRVPDDVTLLWTDDNWGHIQRLPSDSERPRWGGAGVYFHADCVGDVRDYKWINTVNSVQSWQQLALAVEYNATRVWVLNVGDLKATEMPTDFFLSVAYNASAFNKDNILQYQARWAQREFGSEELAPRISAIASNFTRLTAMRKPELVDPTTFSITNYREAETVSAQWDEILNDAAAVMKQLPARAQPAFFETVLHPINATANLHALYIAAGRNVLLASQASNAANTFTDEIDQRFGVDQALKDEFHTMLNGKWNHMMDQTHFGYAYWQQPMQDTLPPIARVFTSAPALAGTMRVTVENSKGAWPGDNVNNCANGYGCTDPTLRSLSPFGSQTRFVDVSPSGPRGFSFNTASSAPWLTVRNGSGSLQSSSLPHRIELGVDWSKFPAGAAGMQNGVVRITSSVGDVVSVTLPAIKTSPPAGFKGFVEGDGVVSMEASHWARSTPVNGVSFGAIPSFGTRAFDGVSTFPGLSGNFTPVGTGPSIEFDFTTFNTPTGGNSTNLQLTTYLYSSFNLLADGPCLFGLSLDGSTFQTVQPIPNIVSTPQNQVYVPDDWNQAVGNAVRAHVTTFTNVAPGKHTLKVSMITPGLVFEKFVANVGGLQTSYLGPPESSQV